MKQEQFTIRTPYGYHDDDTQEYVITRPDTPTPWINYLGEGRYGGIISNTAGGYAFDRDPRNRRVTRYRYNAIPIDQPGRYVYIRDQESGDFWSPTWQPVVGRTLNSYECRHGAGYTRISSSYAGIKTSVRYFVPPTSPDDPCPCELWALRVENASTTPRTLRTFSYVEYSFLDAMIDQTNLDWGMHIVHSRYEAGTLYTATQFRPTTTYMSSNRTPVGFDSDREIFVGHYRDLGNPIVVETGKPQQSEAPRGNNIGSLCHELVLAPGESQEIVYMLGITDQPDTIEAVVKKYHQPEAVAAAYQALRDDWTDYLSRFTVKTPDAELNAMINFWNAVQCRTNLYWSRFISGYDTGLGRGMGTRDSAQDTLSTVHNLPKRARQMLSILWKLQFVDGHTWHQVFPLTGEGGPGLAIEFPDWPQWFSDDHLWLVIATVAYLRETGDLAYLDKSIPYQDGEQETVWEHIERAVQFTLDHLGPQGLPRHGFSDWNDTMNLDHGSGKAESVWTGHQFCRTMLDLEDLCLHMGQTEDAERFHSLHQKMADTINRVAWDGAWYVRAYDDEGKALGVESASYQKISLNAQTWAVIGEVAPRERAQQAMESVHEKLNTPLGLRVMWPPYDKYMANIQGTTTMPPGAKENGSIFCHANTWGVVAAAKMGWGDRALQYYRQFLPLTRSDSDRYLAEPYVYCQNICAPEHPHYGMGRNSWLTGTSSWSYVAATKWILGIQPTFDGLRIAPVVPDAWAGFEVKRIFRGVTYQITVERAGPGNKVQLWVNDTLLDNNIVPVAQDKTIVAVKAVIGE